MRAIETRCCIKIPIFIRYRLRHCRPVTPGLYKCSLSPIRSAGAGVGIWGLSWAIIVRIYVQTASRSPQDRLHGHMPPHRGDILIEHHHTAPLRVQGRQKHGLVRKLAPGVADADVRDFEDDGDGGPATAHNTCLVRPTRQVPLMHVHYRPCASACRCGTTAIGWSGVTVVSDVHPPSSARHAVWPARPPKASPERCGRERRWPTCTHAWWPAGAGRNSVNITHRGTRRARTRPWPGPSQRRRRGACTCPDSAARWSDRVPIAGSQGPLVVWPCAGGLVALRACSSGRPTWARRRSRACTSGLVWDCGAGERYDGADADGSLARRAGVRRARHIPAAGGA